MENLKEEDINNWFEKGEWKQGFSASPDVSIQKKAFAEQYFKNKECWDIAFEFLSTANLQTIELGKYELMGEDVFAMVSEYETKNVEDARLEAHEKYADIQFMIAGEELMGVTDLKNTAITIAYNNDKDVAFMDAPDVVYYKANQDNFFIFLPNNAHRPCVKLAENKMIKKIVIKVVMK